MVGSLRIDNLTVRYGDTLALDGVTAEIPAGCSVAVIGPNGSGKSTLLKAMAGILQPASGSIDLGGRAVATVLQSTEVEQTMPLSVRDTVTMARFPHVGLLGRLRPDDTAAVREALTALGLIELADRQINQLSGGQRQRAFVAQGLAQGAEILLLDEPLTGLDVVSQGLINDALAGAKAEGQTVVVSTHSFAEAERCDLVVLLARRCIALGPPSLVFTERNLQEAFGGRFVKVGDTLVLDDPHHDHNH